MRFSLRSLIAVSIIYEGRTVALAENAHVIFTTLPFYQSGQVVNARDSDFFRRDINVRKGEKAGRATRNPSVSARRRTLNSNFDNEKKDGKDGHSLRLLCNHVKLIFSGKDFADRSVTFFFSDIRNSITPIVGCVRNYVDYIVTPGEKKTSVPIKRKIKLVENL